jgi:4'-phosphopantetheinyl transferase EntD
MSSLTTNPARLSPFVASLLPEGVIAAELRLLVGQELLYPEETAHLARAAPKRVHEYSAGRLCARRALEALGISNFPLLPGSDRQPLWPEAAVGSITHTAGFCAAVVAPRGAFRAVGLDAEGINRVSTNLWPRICTEAEIAWLRQLPDNEQAQFASLIFSAKEAFYKCQYGLTTEWLYFHDASLEVVAASAEGGIFRIHPLKPMKLSAHAAGPWEGRFAFGGDVVVTGMAIVA